MEISIGSIESSDILIVISSKNKKLVINNLVMEIDSKLVNDTITKYLSEYDLIKYNPTVYYTGANTWVINARCEAVVSLVNSYSEQCNEGGNKCEKQLLSNNR
ncbi:hypothetical protein SH1V18_35000 [Vallitalea longa]|uniref:Uncharacterized protein n=1 Tax=Vallitalea longa TaxID=2936439 RepID=A0A9W6DFX0_9FIRM|nr:hypothetical protein [Vallitalea longa]GKX31020.1 hypothetical protein SH1V18_35000 [Vallitalea longa]